METSVAAPSAADLHRWYLGPYCPKCGFLKGVIFRPDRCDNCGGELLPGLHTRCPDTWVEGLIYSPDFHYWYFRDNDAHTPVKPAHAADLLVQGVVKAVWRIEVTNLGSEWMVDLVLAETSVIQRVHQPTLPHAVALAMHRAKDQEEANNG